MAYSDYKTRAQLRGTVTTISAASPDGAPAAWIHNGESAEQTVTNRPVDALALNMDNLKLPFDSTIAVTQVEALAAFASNSFTIDPSGVAGDISLTAATSGTGDDITAGSPCTLDDSGASFTPDMVGRSIIISGAVAGADDGTFPITAVNSATQLEYTNGSAVGETGGAFTYIVTNALYIGNSSYSNNEEDRDTLFQFLDENYNEVVVDGAEVKVSSISGGTAAIGGGFYSGGLVTITLSDTVPSGNYRFKFGVPSSLANLPDDAFITADIRGVHEAAGEVGRRSMYVLDAAGTGYPADFVGATALQDALTALGDETTLFLRNGNYTITSNLDITQNNVTIIGEGVDEGGTAGVDIRLSTGVTLTVSGARNHIENVYISVPTPNGTEDIAISGDDSGFRRCFVQSVGFTLSGFRNYLEKVECDGYGVALDLSGAHITTVDLCRFTSDNLGAPTAVVVTYSGTSAGSGLTMRDTSIYATALPALMLSGLSSPSYTAHGMLFQNCAFYSTDDFAASVSSAHTQDVRFESCSFTQVMSTTNPCLFVGGTSLDVTSISFNDCRVISTSTAVAVATVTTGRGVSFRNCSFERGGSGTNTVGIADFSHDVDHRGTLENCTFLGGGLLAPTSGADVSITGFNGHNLSVIYEDAYPYDGQAPALDLNSSDIVGVHIDFGTGTLTNLTGSYAMIIDAGSKVRDLEFENLKSTWQIPLIYINGTTKLLSELDGLELHESGDSSWKNSTVDEPLVIELGGRCLVRNFKWRPDGTATAAGNDSVMRQADAADTDTIIIENCRIDLGPSDVNFKYLIYLGQASHATEDVIVRDNVFIGGDATDGVTDHVVYLMQTKSLLFINNRVEATEIVSGTETPTSTAVYLIGCERPKIIGNDISAYIKTTPTQNGDQKVLYHHTISAFGGIGYMATTISGNIFRNPAGTNEAWIGNMQVNGYNPGGAAGFELGATSVSASQRVTNTDNANTFTTG